MTQTQTWTRSKSSFPTATKDSSARVQQPARGGESVLWGHGEALKLHRNALAYLKQSASYETRISLDHVPRFQKEGVGPISKGGCWLIHWSRMIERPRPSN
jgi:hypothetical protein